MELYILDDSMRRVDVVEGYTSLIWTERFASYGDFELDIVPSLADPALKTYGTFLACDKSQRVMYIDRAEKTFDEGPNLKVTGKSLEAMLQERPNDYSVISSGGPLAQVTLGPGRPTDIMHDIFVEACLNNQFFAADSLPYIQSGIMNFPYGSMPEPSDIVNIQTDIDNLYSTLKKIAEVYNVGFRLVRKDGDEGAAGKLYFEVYTGFDRTTGQLVNSPMVFGSEFGNLDKTSELVSSENYKNVAYVYGKYSSIVVYAPAVDPTVAGFKRKVIIVKADDIDTTSGSLLTSQLNQRGIEALARANLVWGFDGEIPQQNGYIYGKDYFVGDVVEQRSDDGVMNRMRITEQILASDSDGDRCYPTLSLEMTITPGTWDSVNPAIHWGDIDPSLYWDDNRLS